MNKDERDRLYASAVDEAEYLRAVEARWPDNERMASFAARMKRAGALQVYLCGGAGLTPKAEDEAELFVVYLASGGQRRHGSFDYYRKHHGKPANEISP